MIASFRQSRFSLLFAAMVVAVGLATLTDARAGEPMKRRVDVMKMEPMSPATADVIRKLDTPITTELKSASVDAVLHTIMNATGVSVQIADGAIDDATRAKRLNVKATNIPAHMLLFESLGTLHLAVKFTETGVLVLNPEEDDDVVRMRVPEGQGEPAKTRVFLRRAQEPGAGEPAADVMFEQKIEIDDDSQRGGGKRKLTLRSGEEAEVGQLEIELVEQP